MSILVNGIVLEALPQEFRNDYWRTNHTDESGMNLMPWSVPEATTRSEVMWERLQVVDNRTELWILPTPQTATPEMNMFHPLTSLLLMWLVVWATPQQYRWGSKW